MLFFSEGFKKSDKQQPFLSRKSFFGRLRPCPSPDLDLSSFPPPNRSVRRREKQTLPNLRELESVQAKIVASFSICENGASIFAQVEKCIWSVFGSKRKLYFRVPRKECQNNVSLTPFPFPISVLLYSDPNPIIYRLYRGNQVCAPYSSGIVGSNNRRRSLPFGQYQSIWVPHDR